MAKAYYMKIKDAEGESSAENHEGEIEVDEFGWEAIHQGSAESDEGGRGDMKDFWFKARANKGSPALMQKCANGTRLDGDVIFTCCKNIGGKQEDYIKWT